MAQPGTDKKPVINIRRQLFHDRVNREQANALKVDGRADNLFNGSANEEINFIVTNALTKKVDKLQMDIELDTLTDHNKKLTYLVGLESMLKAFTDGFKKRTFNASYWPVAVDTYEASINNDKRGQSIESFINKSNYHVANMIINSKAFDNSLNFQSSKFSLIRKYAQLYPDRIFHLLKDNFELPFRDSLIIVGAYKNPRILYDFASANNRLGNAIRKIDDPLIKTVSKMATSGGSGQMYFPFLDNILKGKQTIEEIDAVKNDNVKYYKLLVKTRLDYMQRVRAKETIYELEGLTKKLETKAKEVFIKQINALHEESDAVRFKILQQLSPQELYYLAVSGEDEIYTSSYTKGVYPIMMQKIGNRGDSLMVSVGFDRFKKFIKMAAGYNTLNHFLKTFSKPEDPKTLMTAFVNGLEKSQGLEDGVDVADSYVSIAEGNKELAKYVLDLAKLNYDKNLALNNQRGIVMYNLLYKLFLSADSTNRINLSQEFGIPPVYNVSYSSLSKDSQQVVMQVFFYGDEDGRNNYAGFMRQFSGAGWKRTENNQWVNISSTRGKPVVIYANKPLKEEGGEDEKAQDAMVDFLDQKGVEPTIVIHRGHSYYAESTIEHIRPSAKIVFLGSCGGYHLIHDVLAHAPDAHIIASKQIGKGVINQPFFNLLTEKLRNGNNIDWIPFWKEFGSMVTDKEGFQDYIPPHKNLGAIFIKAYKSQMGSEE